METDRGLALGPTQNREETCASSQSASTSLAHKCSTRRVNSLTRHLTASSSQIARGVWDFLTAPPVESSIQNGGQLAAKVLHAHGVKHVFTLSGGHIAPVLVAAKRLGIRVVDCRHEVTTVFAADAVARLTGVPGVAVRESLS